MYDPDFETKLINHRYKTAYDPIARRYVEIKRVRCDEAGRIKILARRVSDPWVHEYSAFELIDYCF